MATSPEVDATIAKIPLSPVYDVTAWKQGLEITFVSTFSAGLSEYRRGGSKLASREVRMLVKAVRFSPKRDKNRCLMHHRGQFSLLMDCITNLYKLIEKVTFDTDIDIRVISFVMKACPLLKSLVFNNAAVYGISPRLVRLAPETLLPTDHSLKEIIFKEVSLTHCLDFIATFKRATSKNISTTFSIFDPVIKDTDLGAVQKLANDFLNDKWNDSLKFDLIAIGKKLEECQDPQNQILSDRIKRILSCMHPHMAVVAARNVLGRSDDEIRATFMKQGPPPLFESMRDYEQHQAILHAPIEAVHFFSGGRLPLYERDDCKKPTVSLPANDASANALCATAELVRKRSHLEMAGASAATEK